MDVLIYAEILFMIGLILLSICNWLMASWVADWIIDKLNKYLFNEEDENNDA